MLQWQIALLTCTIARGGEDAESGIKRSLSRRKNHAFVPNHDRNDLEFYEEAASSSDDEETFSNT